MKFRGVVDFVVVGSGAAGGVVAKELAEAGFTVVVFEQGPHRTEKDFTHDELKFVNRNFLTNNYARQPNTYRATASEKASVRPAPTSPAKPRISPARTVRETPSTAMRPPWLRENAVAISAPITFRYL
mgnify:CR=1 FL=1